MIADPEVAQARTLIQALYEQVADISQKLEALERQAQRARRGSFDPRLAKSLRGDLYEAHRHIDGLHRRFPETRPERQRRDWSSRHTATEERQIGVR